MRYDRVERAVIGAGKNTNGISLAGALEIGFQAPNPDAGLPIVPKLRAAQKPHWGNFVGLEIVEANCRIDKRCERTPIVANAVSRVYAGIKSGPVACDRRNVRQRLDRLVPCERGIARD